MQTREPPGPVDLCKTATCSPVPITPASHPGGKWRAEEHLSPERIGLQEQSLGGLTSLSSASGADVRIHLKFMRTSANIEYFRAQKQKAAAAASCLRICKHSPFIEITLRW